MDNWAFKKINEMTNRVYVAAQATYAPSILLSLINDAFCEFQREGYSDVVAYGKALQCFAATRHIK